MNLMSANELNGIDMLEGTGEEPFLVLDKDWKPLTQLA
jgi:hypothetical protein